MTTKVCNASARDWLGCFVRSPCLVCGGCIEAGQSWRADAFGYVHRDCELPKPPRDTRGAKRGGVVFWVKCDSWRVFGGFAIARARSAARARGV